jgi:hypothetical protein
VCVAGGVTPFGTKDEKRRKKDDKRRKKDEKRRSLHALLAYDCAQGREIHSAINNDLRRD